MTGEGCLENSDVEDPGADVAVGPLHLSHGRTDIAYTAEWLNAYEELQDSAHAAKGEEFAAFERLITASPGFKDDEKSLLDVGCCTGRYTRWADRSGFRRILGIDASPEAIAHCRFQSRRAQYVCSDAITYAKRAAEEGSSFTFVTIMFGTIDHFAEVEQSCLLQHLSRLLEPEGRLFASFWRRGQCDFPLYSPLEQGYLGRREVPASEWVTQNPQSGVQLSKSLITSRLEVLELKSPLNERGGKRLAR